MSSFLPPPSTSSPSSSVSHSESVTRLSVSSAYNNNNILWQQSTLFPPATPTSQIKEDLCYDYYINACCMYVYGGGGGRSELLRWSCRCCWDEMMWYGRWVVVYDRVGGVESPPTDYYDLFMYISGQTEHLNVCNNSQWRKGERGW